MSVHSFFRFTAIKSLSIPASQTVQPVIDGRLRGIHIRTVYPYGLQNLRIIRKRIHNVFHTACQSACPMRTKRDNRFATEFLNSFRKTF